MRRMIIIVVAMSLMATPALAVSYPVNITLKVPVTITDYPASPQGDDLIQLHCEVVRKGMTTALGGATVPIQTSASGSKRNYNGTLTVVMQLKAPAKTGDSYWCRFESITKGFAPATSVLNVDGILP